MVIERCVLLEVRTEERLEERKGWVMWRLGMHKREPCEPNNCPLAQSRPNFEEEDGG